MDLSFLYPVTWRKSRLVVRTLNKLTPAVVGATLSDVVVQFIPECVSLSGRCTWTWLSLGK